MTARSILKGLCDYNKARLKFCEMIGNEANSPEAICFMEGNGVTDLLIPLVEDLQLNVRCNAINCLSRMANLSQHVAEQLIERNIPQLILRQFVQERNNSAFFKRVVMQALTRIAKHSTNNAVAVSEAGGLSSFLCSIEDQNVSVKQMAVTGLGCLVSKSSMIATAAINNGAATLLVMCLQHNELCLKVVTALTIGDLVIHSPDHARAVVESSAVIHLSRALNNIDGKLKKNVLYALANIASHNKDLAEVVVEADVLPRAIIHLNHELEHVRRQSIRLIQELAKHSMELAQLIVNSGGLGAIIQMIFSMPPQKDVDATTYAATTLGYIAGQSPHFALAIIESKGVQALLFILSSCRKQYEGMHAQAIWALGHVGKHTPEHSRALGEANVYLKVLDYYEDPCTADDTKKKCKCMLKLCLQRCLHLPSLEPLLYNASSDILKYTVGQYSKILPHDPAARRIFITTGGLKKIQEIQAQPGTQLFEYVAVINNCYPEDIVRYYAPEFPEQILERVDQYKPPPVSPAYSDNSSMDTCDRASSKKHPPSRKSSKSNSSL